ncbi:MAG: hypothetical protein EZS28_001100 [Streblomastix strix]|uniref:C2 domain-containing protein n=1 Tax=Streblomastix strix TaxID=222440 RepID=A0A5J4X882_9EUKA|nr:MAG: hypothetical protein EZS28_001100 [Streblomastix strix]
MARRAPKQRVGDERDAEDKFYKLEEDKKQNNRRNAEPPKQAMRRPQSQPNSPSQESQSLTPPQLLHQTPPQPISLQPHIIPPDNSSSNEQLQQLLQQPIEYQNSNVNYNAQPSQQPLTQAQSASQSQSINQLQPINQQQPRIYYVFAPQQPAIEKESKHNNKINEHQRSKSRNNHHNIKREDDDTLSEVPLKVRETDKIKQKNQKIDESQLNKESSQQKPEMQQHSGQPVAEAHVHVSIDSERVAALEQKISLLNSKLHDAISKADLLRRRYAELEQRFFAMEREHATVCGERDVILGRQAEAETKLASLKADHSLCFPRQLELARLQAGEEQREEEKKQLSIQLKRSEGLLKDERQRALSLAVDLERLRLIAAGKQSEIDKIVLERFKEERQQLLNEQQRIEEEGKIALIKQQEADEVKIRQANEETQKALLDVEQTENALEEMKQASDQEKLLLLQKIKQLNEEKDKLIKEKQRYFEFDQFKDDELAEAITVIKELQKEPEQGINEQQQSNLNGQQDEQKKKDQRITHLEGMIGKGTTIEQERSMELQIKNESQKEQMLQLCARIRNHIVFAAGLCEVGGLEPGENIVCIFIADIDITPPQRNNRLRLQIQQQHEQRAQQQLIVKSFDPMFDNVGPDGDSPPISPQQQLIKDQFMETKKSKQSPKLKNDNYFSNLFQSRPPPQSVAETLMFLSGLQLFIVVDSPLFQLSRTPQSKGPAPHWDYAVRFRHDVNSKWIHSLSKHTVAIELYALIQTPNIPSFDNTGNTTTQLSIHSQIDQSPQQLLQPPPGIITTPIVFINQENIMTPDAAYLLAAGEIQMNELVEHYGKISKRVILSAKEGRKREKVHRRERERERQQQEGILDRVNEQGNNEGQDDDDDDEYEDQDLWNIDFILNLSYETLLPFQLCVGEQEWEDIKQQSQNPTKKICYQCAKNIKQKNMKDNEQETKGSLRSSISTQASSQTQSTSENGQNISPQKHSHPQQQCSGGIWANQTEGKENEEEDSEERKQKEKEKQKQKQKERKHKHIDDEQHKDLDKDKDKDKDNDKDRDKNKIKEQTPTQSQRKDVQTPQSIKETSKSKINMDHLLLNQNTHQMKVKILILLIQVLLLLVKGSEIQSQKSLIQTGSVRDQEGSIKSQHSTQIQRPSSAHSQTKHPFDTANSGSLNSFDGKQKDNLIDQTTSNIDKPKSTYSQHGSVIHSGRMSQTGSSEQHENQKENQDNQDNQENENEQQNSQDVQDIQYDIDKGYDETWGEDTVNDKKNTIGSQQSETNEQQEQDNHLKQSSGSQQQDDQDIENNKNIFGLTTDTDIEGNQQDQHEKDKQEQEQEQEQDLDVDLKKGKVKVTVIGVKDVAAMDFNGKSDPFIVVKNGTNEFKTKKVKNTLNAEYNETFEFEYDSATNEDRSIHFELWDYDTIGDNDQIGKLNTPV